VWPFDERLKEQNAIEKYRRWLKRWLLTGSQNRQKTTPRFIYPGVVFCLFKMGRTHLGSEAGYNVIIFVDF